MWVGWMVVKEWMKGVRSGKEEGESKREEDGVDSLEARYEDGDILKLC